MSIFDKALRSLRDKFYYEGNPPTNAAEYDAIKSGIPDAPTWSEMQSTMTALQADFDSKQYSRDRQAEYPSIEELVVALYDSEDKAEIDRRRAEVKNKYPITERNDE